ncbi:MAG: hypothetical protein HKN76_09275 [Saprospiraceae bacterium]|nr:hypothetical protein [Saprospiraceae bacterium]
MIRIFFASIVSMALAISCASQGESDAQDANKERVTMTPGNYKAVVNMEKMADDVKAFSMTSEITFGFEADQTFIYQVFAMGKENNDIGRWEVRGDSLYIFSLQRGPDSAFKLIKTADDRYEIIGPNHFILTRKEEITPIKE